MPTTRRSTRAPKGDVRTETLGQFSDQLDAHLGKKVQFADIVMDMHEVKVKAEHVKKARSAVFAHVKKAYEIGHRQIMGTTYDLAITNPQPGDYTLTVTSAAAKKASPEKWKKAHIRAPFRQIKAPAAFTAAVELPELPVGWDANFIEPVTAVKMYQDHPAWSLISELRDEDDHLHGELLGIAHDCDWDGDLIVFADGWSVQLTRMQFDSAAFEQVDSDLFFELADYKQKQAAPRIYVTNRGGDHWDEDTSEGYGSDYKRRMGWA